MYLSNGLQFNIIKRKMISKNSIVKFSKCFLTIMFVSVTMQINYNALRLKPVSVKKMYSVVTVYKKRYIHKHVPTLYGVLANTYLSFQTIIGVHTQIKNIYIKSIFHGRILKIFSSDCAKKRNSLNYVPCTYVTIKNKIKKS